MKLLTLHQPYATAIALGIKHYETRSWGTRYQGLVAIHAAKTMPAYARRFAESEVALGRLPARLPLGAVVAVAELRGLHAVRGGPEVVLELGVDGGLERLYGNFDRGRLAWRLENVRALPEPFALRGGQGLVSLTAECEALILAALEVPDAAARG